MEKTKLAVLAIVIPSCLSAVILTAGPVDTGKSEVQNMIRDSQQRSWCRIGHIKQIITHANCESKEVENLVCAGSCFSYSLPQTDPNTPGDEELNFCESCQASQSHWINITLSCAIDESLYEVSKRVQQISNCTCTACPGSIHSFQEVNEAKDGDRIPVLLSSALPPEPLSDPHPPHLNMHPSSPPSSEISSSDARNESTEPLSDVLLEQHAETADHHNQGERGPPYHKLPGPFVLKEEEVIFNPEGESDPNLLLSGDMTPEDDSQLGLLSIMDSLTNIKYQGMSINAIKTAVSELEKKKKMNEVKAKKEKREEHGDETDSAITLS